MKLLDTTIGSNFNVFCCLYIIILLINYEKEIEIKEKSPILHLFYKYISFFTI